MRRRAPCREPLYALWLCCSFVGVRGSASGPSGGSEPGGLGARRAPTVRVHRSAGPPGLVSGYANATRAYALRVTRGCAVSACLAHALPRCNLFRSLAPVRALPTSVVCDSRSRVSSLCCHALWTLLGCMPCCLLTHLRLLQLCMGSIWPRRLVPVAVACACPASLARSPSRRSRAVCAGTLPPSSCLSRLSLAGETFDLRSSTLSQARCRLGRRQPTRGKRRARQHVAGCAPP